MTAPSASFASRQSPAHEDYAGLPELSDTEGIGVSLAQAICVLRAHWRAALIVMLSVVVLAAVFTKLVPKTYTSVATLIVNAQPNDPLAEREVQAGMMGNYIATQVELLQGPDVLDQVISRLKLTENPEYAAGNKGGAPGLRDWVESKLRRNLDISQGRAGSQLIYIGASASSAQLAADLANAIAEVYTEQESVRTSGPANERASRYSEELADLKHKVEKAQQALTQFRDQTGAVDMDSRASVDLDLLNSLEHRLLDARNTLRSNEAHAVGRQDVSGPVLASTSVSGLRAEEAKLKSRMAQLRTELGPNHPQVLELQSQIDANAASLEAALATYSKAASSDLIVSGSEVSALERAVQVQREKVLRDQSYHDQSAKYQLELDSAQSVYKRALDGFDQAKFATSGGTSNLSIAARARPPVKADKPNPIKYMALGLMLGLALGCITPFALELPNRRIRCVDDLEKSLGIPVLVEFPGDAIRRPAAAVASS